MEEEKCVKTKILIKIFIGAKEKRRKKEKGSKVRKREGRKGGVKVGKREGRKERR